MDGILCGLNFPINDKVLVGSATADDAGVYKISDDLALIQTLDFFTPVVDNPYDFGRIAAANSLSDVYAMGGVPKTAMNIVAYPLEQLGRETLKEILAGGIEVMRQAGTVLLGGHSIDDPEVKYGLSVTGFVHPESILTNQGLRDGDCLILTKPLGTGIVNTAVKAGLASEGTIREVTELMSSLNKGAAEVMRNFDVSGCTDITGFGLIGHLAEMIAGTPASIVLQAGHVPVIAGAYEFASMGLVPSGAHKNRNFRHGLIDAPAAFDPVLRDILYDPQTSGGLLFGVPKKEVDVCLQYLHDSGVVDAAVIGRVTVQTDHADGVRKNIIIR